MRITGGEPLVRSDVPVLIRLLRQTPGITDLALTTNGIPLADMADELRQAGLDRVNISLDTLREDEVRADISATGTRPRAVRHCRRPAGGVFPDPSECHRDPRSDRGRDPALGGFRSAATDWNCDSSNSCPWMPTNSGKPRKSSAQTKCGGRWRSEWGPLRPAPRTDPNQPAVDFEYADGRAKVGFIVPVSEPFCGDCSRLRLTSEGQVRNCLFSDDEFDVRALLRSGGADQARSAERRSAAASACQEAEAARR